MTDSALLCRTRSARKYSAWLLIALGLYLSLGVSGRAWPATFVVTNINTAGQGFNDTTPVAPVTGNPATTVGAQRMAVFQAAADSWGALLQSPVNIVVSAQMTSLTCSSNSAVLGSAGAAGITRDFPNAPQANTWYPIALANSLAGSDLDPGTADINANFNQDIGKPGCLQSAPWSYVIGAAAPANSISFFDTVVHEIGHGLGFASFANSGNGQLLGGFSDSYTRHLLDETPAPTLWTALNNAGRAASAIDTGNLTWNGGSVNAVAGLLTAGRHGTSSRVRMYAPNPLVNGSSVSHFDTALSPNEIMEPSLTSVNRRRLANHLMLDLGWRARVNLTVSNSNGSAELPAGSPTTYTIIVQNNNAGDLTVINLGVLNTPPAALQSVSWSCTGQAGGSCTASNGLGNINTQVTVPQAGSVVFTVNAVVDEAFTGTLNNTVNLVLPANLQNQNPATLTATDSTNIIVAADPAGFTISSISGDTTEAGVSAIFSVVLNTQPTSNVSLGLSSSDTTEGTVSPSALLFTNGNWNVPQLVTVTGQDDFIDDGDIAHSIITAAAVSSDPDYSGLNPANVAVTNLDDDTAGISVSAISGDTSESGMTAEFTLVLNSEPMANVSIGLVTDDSTEGTAAPDTLLFSSANWNTPQTVMVSGADDDVDDGDIAYSIISQAATSADPKYQGLNPADVTVINRDDDTAGIAVSAASGNTSEDGLTATFTIELDSEPTADVSISLSSSNEAEGLVSPGLVTFTPATWFEEKLVTITGQDDVLKDGDVSYSIITAPAVSLDPGYSGLDPADIQLLNLDNDGDLIFRDGFDSP